MAVVITNSAAGVAGILSAAMTYTPAAGVTLIAYAVQYKAGSLPAAINTISDNAAAPENHGWTLIDEHSWDNVGSRDIRVAAFKKKFTTSPGSIVITAAGTSINNLYMSIAVCSGNDFNTIGANLVWNDNAAGDPAGTLPSVPATDSATLVLAMAMGNNSFAAITGFVILVNATVTTGGDDRKSLMAWDAPPSPLQVWATTSNCTYTVALTLEIPILAVAAGGMMKVWSGSAWASKPAKVWSGAAWVQKPVKVWTGSVWKVAT